MHGFLFISLYSLIRVSHDAGAAGDLAPNLRGDLGSWRRDPGRAPRPCTLDARATPQSAPEARDTRTSLLHGPRGQLGQGVRGLPQYLIYSYKIEPVRRGVAMPLVRILAALFASANAICVPVRARGRGVAEGPTPRARCRAREVAAWEP